jgi:hypothetical protein
VIHHREYRGHREEGLGLAFSGDAEKANGLILLNQEYSKGMPQAGKF